MSVRVILVISTLLLGVLAIVVTTNKGGKMPETIIGRSAEMSDYTPFPEDVAEIETAWGAPLPHDLYLIGGPDEIGYARVILTEDAATGTFEGSLLNARIRYSGPLRYEHPQDKPVPDISAGGYVLSHIENDRLVVGQENAVPRDWFYLVPALPQQIERAP